MEIDRIYAIGLLGLFAALLVGHQGSKVIRSGYSHWGALCNYADTHLVLPKIFQGRLFFNPTRSEALCHVLHWISVIIFNTYRVTTLSAAEKRTALLAVIHLVPLVVSLQLSHIANSVGLSARTVSKIHASIGLMATLQGVAHASMHLWARHYPADQAVPGILSMTALLALTLLPLARRFAYEVFLYIHRALTVTIMAALWTHITDPQSFARLLLIVALCSLAVTTALHWALLIYRNCAFRDWRFHTTKIIGIAQAGETIILRVQLARPRAIAPGQYFHVTILTWRLGYIFQRHPLMIAWWDTPRDHQHPQVLYFVIKPRRGWTKSLQRHYVEIMANVTPDATVDSPGQADQPVELDYTCRQCVWMDGPFGVTPDWRNLDTYLLFASGEGVFAHLPLVRFLTEKSKTDPYATRKIVLVWEADEPHFTLKRWIQSILRDEHVRRDLLEMHIYFPPSSFKRLPSDESMGGERLKVVPQSSVDVSKFFGSAESSDLLRHSSKDIAVIVSGTQMLRDKVRAEVLFLRRIDVRFSESEYQPVDT